MLRKLILALMASGLLAGTTACNTVDGAGKDLQSASKSAEEAINQ